MNNFYQTFQAEARSASEKRLHKTLYPTRKNSSNEQLALGSYNRANNWAKEKMVDDDILKTLKNGVTPLKHTDWHDFRTPEGEIINSKSNIYVRKYLPAKQRADVAQKDHHSAYLQHVPFTSPRNAMQQNRVPEKEVGPIIRHGVRTQSERLNNHLNGTNRLIDAALTDNKMIYYPDWRDHDKAKWTSPKAFDTTTCLYQGRKALDPWKMVPGGINIGDSYVEGFEVVGDLSRKRHLALEIATKDFLTTVTPNHSSKFIPPMDSNSIRTSKSAKFIGVGPTADQKTFPKSLRHILTQNPEFNETLKSTPQSSRSSAMPKVIQIKTGVMEPMKESYLSSTGYKTRSDSSPMTEKSFFKTGFSRRAKNASPDRGDYIKQAVKSYFD